MFSARYLCSESPEKRLKIPKKISGRLPLDKIKKYVFIYAEKAYFLFPIFCIKIRVKNTVIF